MLLSALLVLATTKISLGELVVTGSCDEIKFQQPLFTSKKSKEGSDTHGKFIDPSEKITGSSVLIIPSYEDYNNEPTSILIYPQRDSEFIKNLPQKALDLTSWPDSFGLCTEDDIAFSKCKIPGEFIIEVNDQGVEDRIINKVLEFEEKSLGGFNPIILQVNSAKYCYIVAIDKIELEDDDEKAKNNENSRPIISVQPIHIEAENTIAYLEFYGFIFGAIIEFLLGIVIWFKIRSINDKSDLPTPYKGCFSIIIISLITSVTQILSTRQYIEPIDYGSNSLSFFFKHSEFFRSLSNISETLDDILIYLICFQFVNLDNFGIIINFKKNRYGYIFIAVLIWTLMIHPFIVNYRYQILSTALKKISGEEYHLPDFSNTVLKEFVEVFNILNFITIWFLLYKTSQDSEINFLINNTKLKQYAQLFKSTRIWLIFSAIIIKIVGFILGRYIYKLDWKFIQYIESHIEESYYKEVLVDVILSKMLLSTLIALLILLKSADILALPILTVITLKIWWSY